jgi:hypothetical protein
MSQYTFTISNTFPSFMEIEEAATGFYPEKVSTVRNFTSYS